MNIRYHQLLKIEMVHSYFPEGRLSNLDLSPSSHTADLMQNNELLLRKLGNEVNLYRGAEQGESLLNESLRELGELTFIVRSSDPLFYNYTNIPFKDQNHLIFFSNNKASKNQLTIKEITSEEDVESIAQHPLLVQVPDGVRLLQIKTISGQVIFEKQLEESQETTQAIDLSRLPIGKLDVWLDGKLSNSVYNAPLDLPDNSIGILTINISDFIDNPPDDNTYHLSFESRDAFWKYQIVISENRGITFNENDIKISMPSALLNLAEGEVQVQEKQFEGPEKETILGTQEVRSFISPHAIPLRQVLPAYCELDFTYDTVSNRDQELHMKLPNPSVEYLKNYQPNEQIQSFLLTTIVYV